MKTKKRMGPGFRSPLSPARLTRWMEQGEDVGVVVNGASLRACTGT